MNEDGVVVVAVAAVAGTVTVVVRERGDFKGLEVGILDRLVGEESLRGESGFGDLWLLVGLAGRRGSEVRREMGEGEVVLSSGMVGGCLAAAASF